MPSVWANAVRGSGRTAVKISVGIAEQEAQHVQVMDAHVEQGQPVVVAQEILPVRDRAHLDRGDHRLAQVAAVEQLLEDPHRLVEAHVLVDRQHLAGVAAFRLDPLGLGQIERQGLLRQDRLDVRLPQRVADQVRLLVGREGDVDDLDLGVLDQRARACRGPARCPSAWRPRPPWRRGARRSRPPGSRPRRRRPDGRRP